ncbi:hypothetical protein FHS61_002989 [Altererythrobacter atlanticus]|uniref:Uncharacterized protein n=1 Tax=Croceibacterium atlanticum TaxID=1267766 RepID=A0A0F7KYL5_9SPHN|nr:hypothetical protein [Croceibacterium atlanticum]AKH44341.1 hypothetical protein WYH_03322 [Croceibacterium atlanticum]MBB5733942.1 hypothetical protein [Croceibacterium atlanticum]
MILPSRHSSAVFAMAAVLMTGACSQSEETETEAAPQSSGAIERSHIGEVNATMDGTAYRGATLAVPSEGTATAEFRKIGPTTMISVQAHDPDADSVMHNVINLGFTLAGEDASAPLAGVTISYFPDGMDEPFYSSESSETAPQISLESLSLEEGSASAIGQFTASLCRKARFFAEADTSDCMNVEGSFDTALRKGA